MPDTAQPASAATPRPQRQWFTSPVNERVEVAADAQFPRQVIIHETTLREGMQASPVTFSPQEKIEVGQILDAIGIPQIQIGYGKEDRIALDGLKSRGVQAQLSVLVPAFSRDWQERVNVATDSGADIILMLFRASDRQLELLGLGRDEACDRLADAVAYARDRSRGLVAANASFATMADPAFLVELMSRARDAGAERFGIADSSGVASPETVGFLVGQIRGAVGEHPVSVHTHNDFGLAVATAIAGLRSGATIADSSILGLGERAGNAPTEQLAVALEGLYGLDTGIALDRLNEAVRAIATIANVPVPRAQPIVGEDVFAQKLEMHVQVTVREPSLHEPFSPETVGAQRFLRLGSGTGEIAVRTKLTELGLSLTDEAIPMAVEWINVEAARLKRGIADAEFEQWVTEAAAVGDGHQAVVDDNQ